MAIFIEFQSGLFSICSFILVQTNDLHNVKGETMTDLASVLLLHMLIKLKVDAEETMVQDRKRKEFEKNMESFREKENHSKFVLSQQLEMLKLEVEQMQRKLQQGA